MLVAILVIVAVLLIVALFCRSSERQQTYQYYYYDDDENDNDGDAVVNESDELRRFEQFYRQTLHVKFKQRTSYRSNFELKKFSSGGDDNVIFDRLEPFANANDFAELLYALGAYTLMLGSVGVDGGGADGEYDDFLADRLGRAIEIIHDRLPMPAPIQRLPWNFDEKYWYVFSVALPECLMQLCIALRPYRDHGRRVADIINAYLPEPNLSLGWRRPIAFSTRMCLPFVYAQMIGGAALRDIVEIRSVANVLHELRHEKRDTGTGIRHDNVNFVDTNVRNYSFLIENYFTFDYYNFLFGENYINMDNVDASIHLVGNDRGIVHPALAYKNGQHIISALRYIMDYAPGFYSADHSKIVSVRNENYYASLVCPVNGVAYYQANYHYRRHALLWTMTKRIWPHNAIIDEHVIIDDDDDDDDDKALVGVDSGMILLDGRAEYVLPVDDALLPANTSMSFLPNPAFTGIVVTSDCAAAMSYCKFDALNVEYYSYTVYHRTGMLQLYDRIKTLTIRTQTDAECVIVGVGDARVHKHDHRRSYNGIVVKHHNIINYKNLQSFELSNGGNHRYLRQIISRNEINGDDDDDGGGGGGTACYSLCTENDNNSTTTVTKLDPNRYVFKVVAQNGVIECVFDFPFLLVKNNETRQLTINNAYSSTRDTHTIHFDDVRRMLAHVSLTVDNLQSGEIARTEFAFIRKSVASNQFAFVY
ncbi:ODV-E66B [Alphabaculovirus myunipunctae]|uniref:ODV-E66B n=1 Tax=Mythimna unipuncta nucleopolyhedrovirus TaxID=447897 RepID=A0A2K9VSG6_9ABAC|nr:ODV-E66B [Mythimna unipuncta nucleopolyhedrovirus]AUV65390.1 ODV-E66B [Mythimna unipuncta nucleopolyhedrovirus]